MFKVLSSFFTKRKKWEDIEFFDEGWKERIKQMAALIKKQSTVLDLGCGKMWLQEFLPAGSGYIPVDYKKRSPDCIVADFNKKEFPAANADIAFISGCLEYIEDYEWFLQNAVSHSNEVILSYCTTDEFPAKNERKGYMWVNHLSKKQIIGLFNSLHCSLQYSSVTKERNDIFLFQREG